MIKNNININYTKLKIKPNNSYIIYQFKRFCIRYGKLFRSTSKYAKIHENCYRLKERQKTT